MASDTVTMDDVIQGDKEIENEANVVLGNAETNQCTFHQGYMRQPVYSCITCCPVPKDKKSTSKCAGICLGCSLNCHDGHELIELYSKRNFKCDCGTSKFKSSVKKNCSLNDNDSASSPRKDVVNSGNVYNHNYFGLYCRCNLPYGVAPVEPKNKKRKDSLDLNVDPMEMMQCCLCEDWFHLNHVSDISEKLPLTDSKQGNTENKKQITYLKQQHDKWVLNEEYDEAICGTCMKKYSFLYEYHAYHTLKPNATGISTDLKSAVPDKDDCKFEELTQFLMKKGYTVNMGRATSWKSNWRSLLCKCIACMSRYYQRKLVYLTDPNDPLSAYVEGTEEMQDAEALGLKAFNTKFSHEQQIEMARGYEKLASHLKEYLTGFADRRQVVRKEDIDEIFSTLPKAK